MGESEAKSETSLKDQGNEFFKAGNYLKAAALYTQAIKKDPSNATLYRSIEEHLSFSVNHHVVAKGALKE
uniref:Heat shock protein 70 (HSP70)-interacting protein n=1 Tax=Solanum tuberosum TaxID=4113 RepID=M1ACQ4_SOLTU